MTAQEAFEETLTTPGGHLSRELLANHWARLVDLVQTHIVMTLVS